MVHEQTLRTMRELLGSDPRSVSEEQIKKLVKKIKHKRSAGDATLTFSYVVLSVIGEDKRLNEAQKKLLCELVWAMNDRPLPTMLWADFVKARLDQPATIKDVLTLFCLNALRIKERFPPAMEQSYYKLGLSKDRPIVVFGYSETIVAALSGLPLTVVKNLKIFTPEYLPNRTVAEGVLLREALLAEVPGISEKSIKVEDSDFVLKRIKEGEPSLVLMGCRVIGLRKTKSLEIVNSHNALDYATAASEVSIPVAVVAGFHKCWPTRTYERYRPKVVLDTGNDIVRGEMIRWIITEDGIFPHHSFATEYDSFFKHGIPLAAVRESFSKDKCLKRLGELGPKLDKITKELEVEGEAEELPRHFIEAQRYYEKVLKKDENWLQSHLGKHVALVGNQVVGYSWEFHELASKVRESYGYGPIFMPRVTKGREVAHLGPRLVVKG